MNIYVKVKVKCTLVQALRLCTGHTAHRGSRGIAILFLDHGTRRGEWSASRPGRSLPRERTGDKDEVELIPVMLLVTNRQHRRCFIPQAVNTVYCS